MPQKWYQKASVQGAIVAGLALSIVTLVPVALKVPRLESDNSNLDRKLREKTAEVQHLETLLEPFRTIALERYTGSENEALTKLASQIQALQDQDVENTHKIESLQKELQNTSEQARPPILTLISSNVVINGDARVVTLRFKPSKNQPLGLLTFNANLLIGSTAQITDFSPTTGGGAFQLSDDSKRIVKDGKAAILIYSLASAGYPTMELKLSAPTAFRISGEYIPDPIVVVVK